MEKKDLIGISVDKSKATERVPMRDRVFKEGFGQASERPVPSQWKLRGDDA